MKNINNISVGLSDGDIKAIVDVLKKYVEVQEACIFGSRAKGNYKQGSDIDIALKGQSLTFSSISSILYELNEESIMPYKFDILNYNTIDSLELKDHIDRVGILFYLAN